MLSCGWVWLLALGRGRGRVRRRIFLLLRGVGSVAVLGVEVSTSEGRVLDVSGGSGSILARSCGVGVWAVGSMCCVGLFWFRVGM
jgi:hypothetical protein